MFRKFRLAIFLGILVLVAAVASGVSYWVFDDANAVYNSAVDVGGSGGKDNASTDKIYENYSFSQTNQSDEYTFYFFPSTLYLEFDSSFGTQVKPEDVFGYNEVLFNDRGEILTNENGDPSYDVVKSSRTMYLVYRQSRSCEQNWLPPWNWYWTTDWSSPVFDSYYTEDPSENYAVYDEGLYFTQEEADKKPGRNQEQTGYTIVKCDSYYDLLNTGLNGYNNYYLSKSSADGSEHGYPRFNGSTSEILSPIYNDPRLESDNPYKSLELTLVNYRNESVDNDNNWNGNHRQYRNDRFGYWNTFYDLDDPNNKDYSNNNNPTDGKGSRYLPIKITVNGSLSPELMRAVIPSPMSSMCNKASYYYFYSNCRVYVDEDNETNSRPYSKALDGFNSNSQSNIFDVMQNPSRYAVQETNENGETENVIRLYPVYSSGKKRSQDEGDGIDFGLTETPNDQLRANFTYTNDFKSSNPLESVIAETMLTFSDEIITYNKGNVLTYAILNNVNLSQKDKYEEITITLCTYNGSEHSGGSTIAYTLNKETLNSLIDVYGTGNYNFYVFVRRQNDFGSSLNVLVGQEAGKEIKNYFTNNLTSTDSPFLNNEYDKGYFESLNKKNLIYFPYLNNDGNLNVSYSGNADKNVHESTIDRPLLFTFEKVSDLKMITDIPLDNLTTGGNGIYTGDFSWENDIDPYISEEYHNTQNMIVADGVYNVSKYFTDEKNDYNDGYVTVGPSLPADNYPELSSDNPYIYVLQNVDFRYVNSLFFQIRLGDKYVQNAMDINVNLSNQKDVPQYIAYESGRDKGKPTYSYFASQSALFPDNEEEYFIQKASVTDSNGVTREGLKLKDYYAKGLYDIMLVATSSENNKFKCNLYLKRHKNDFIKILDSKPDSISDIPGVEGVDSKFVNHYDDNKIIWESNFYIGDSLTSGSLSNKGQSIYKLFYENYNDGQLYGLYDSTTDEPIAFFQNGTFYSAEGSTDRADKEINFFILLKNYVLYVKEVKAIDAV